MRLLLSCSILAGCGPALEDEESLEDEVQVPGVDAARVAKVKALLERYVAAFVSPVTDLAYDVRLDGPLGIGALESPGNVARGVVTLRTLEAEEAAQWTATAGARWAGPPSGWDLYATGSLTSTAPVSFPKGRAFVQVVASGTVAEGGAPRLSVAVEDGASFRELGEVSVSPGSWATYTFSHSSDEAVSRRVRIRFTNDLRTATEDRNLRIDKVVVEADRPYGYGSGLADLAYHNGQLLYALCDAHERTGDEAFALLARRLLRGLVGMSKVSPVRGFVPRGPHPDGRSYYRDSSLDQHSLYVAGLWRYFRSPLSTPEERQSIRDIVQAVVERMESPGGGVQWSIQVEDSSRPAYAGGTMLTMSHSEAVLLLSMLAAAHDVTGEPRWRDAYARFRAEQGGRRWILAAQAYPWRFYKFVNQDFLRMDILRRALPSKEERQQLRAALEQYATRAATQRYLEAWQLTHLGDDPADATPPLTEVARWLSPLGYRTDSAFTALDLWGLYEPSAWRPQDRSRYEQLTLTIPALAWQLSLLSRQPGLVEQVQRPVGEMLDRVDFSAIRSDWTYNYAVLAAVWSVAFPNPALP